MPLSRVTGPAQGYCLQTVVMRPTIQEMSLPHPTLLNSFPLLYSTVLCPTLHVTTAQHSQDAQDPFTSPFVVFAALKNLLQILLVGYTHWASFTFPLPCAAVKRCVKNRHFELFAASSHQTLRQAIDNPDRGKLAQCSGTTLHTNVMLLTILETILLYPNLIYSTLTFYSTQLYSAQIHTTDSSTPQDTIIAAIVQFSKDGYIHWPAVTNPSPYTVFIQSPYPRIVTSCTLLPVTAGLVVRIFCLLFIFNEGFLTPLCRGHKRCFAYRRRTSRRPFINRFETPTWKNLMPIAKKDSR